jgi:hypothetical protein
LITPAKIVLFLEITNYFFKRLKKISLPYISAWEGDDQIPGE